MSKCHATGCRNLETVCKDCARVVCTKTLPPMQEWISVKDKYPKHGDDVLATDGKKVKEMPFFMWDNGPSWTVSARFMGPITYWMLLPEPPKDSNE